MTRSFDVLASATRITQPLQVVRPREPDIHSLGFQCFRLLKIPGEDQLAAITFVNRRNMMSVFAERLGTRKDACTVAWAERARQVG